MIVGVDAGLVNTGLVVLEEDFETVSFNLIQAEPSPAKRLYDIEVAVDAILSELDNEDLTIFMEGYAYGAKYQRESLAELGGVLRRYFYLEDLPYWIIPPLNLKQFVSGSARANKNYMMKCTREKWGIDFKNDDVCDAYGLARIGVHVLTNSVPTEFYENKVVSEILNNKDWYFEPNTAARLKHK